jgi:hypothetical protein
MRSRIIRLGAAALFTVLGAFFFFGSSASGIGPGTPAPELKGGPWLNSGPLKLKDLRGKVVLIKMWTFS